MTLTESIAYIANAAKELGYSYQEFSFLVKDIESILYSVEETDKETLDKIIEEML